MSEQSKNITYGENLLYIVLCIQQGKTKHFQGDVRLTERKHGKENRCNNRREKIVHTLGTRMKPIFVANNIEYKF